MNWFYPILAFDLIRAVESLTFDSLWRWDFDRCTPKVQWVRIGMGRGEVQDENVKEGSIFWSGDIPSGLFFFFFPSLFFGWRILEHPYVGGDFETALPEGYRWDFV